MYTTDFFSGGEECSSMAIIIPSQVTIQEIRHLKLDLFRHKTAPRCSGCL